MVERIAYQLAVHRGFRAVAVLGQDRWLRVRVVSVLLGLLLFTSAVLKTHQLATEPVRGTGLLESRWFVTAVVEYELLLSFWLFWGLFRRTAWWVSVGTFAGFAVVAAAKAVSGEASCGCFGRLPTSPWLAVSRRHTWIGSCPLRSCLRWLITESLTFVADLPPRRSRYGIATPLSKVPEVAHVQPRPFWCPLCGVKQ